VENQISNHLLKLILKLLKPSYEDGDYFGKGTFIHVFTEEELKDEVEKQDFIVRDLSHGPIYSGHF
jgi:hypothetical protein